MSKHTLIKGTLILTCAGFLTRILGFFTASGCPDIWVPSSSAFTSLSSRFTASVLPFTLPASGTAISKLAAESERFLPRTVLKSRPEAERAAARLVFGCGLLLSFSLALFLSFFLYELSPWIARHFLFEARAAAPLRILSFIFPFCSITACINGYYYGTKKSATPAMTQMLEQTIRIVSVRFLSSRGGSIVVSCELAVVGLICGEAASALFNLASIAVERTKDAHRLSAAKVSAKCSHTTSPHKSPGSTPSIRKTVFRELGALAFPLSFNRLVISLLHSFEATLVPFMLRKYGMNSADALSHYGILNGMSLPFIFFPTAITGALSVLLLPAVSQANIRGEKEKLNSTVFLAQKFSILLGILSTALFILFGVDLGNTVFHEPLAGHYLLILAWLCPFLYVSSTFNSILNGLGKPYQTFLNSVIAMCLKIAVLFFGIPRFGMQAYFFAILLSQIVITLMDGILLFRLVGMSCLPNQYLPKGVFALTILGTIFAPIYQHAKSYFPSPYLALLCCGGGYTICTVAAFLLSGVISVKEIKSLKG